ncbi:MAG: hypothetical protein NTW19_11885 [Planctomycetota bacterium]|nr:hypothetical protein [Planctomycetota bacterium]
MTYNVVDLLDELMMKAAEPNTTPEPATPTPMHLSIGPDDLPGDWRCEWEERAAIMEYDAGLPRERAEARALGEITDLMRAAGVRMADHNEKLLG